MQRSEGVMDFLKKVWREFLKPFKNKFQPFTNGFYLLGNNLCNLL
ncbi:hypothetical protein SAMN05444405_11338 [Bacteroides luti]|uniref:Uncharacterized protein n=1 Tax=Bacteroides luti TaxID=1297750 RepID=A0A1M5E705_9BACE|nr:hypothetical protein SAMN05444405_11338 [Bacteroides luti]